MLIQSTLVINEFVFPYGQIVISRISLQSNNTNTKREISSILIYLIRTTLMSSYYTIALLTSKIGLVLVYFRAKTITSK